MIIALGIIGAPVAADEYTIDNSTTIAAAIAAAAPGDTIINLDPGIYFEHDIILDRNLVIRANTGAGGSAADTIINATKSGRIFSNSGGHALTIDNLTLQNGHPGGGGAQYGGAIYAGTGSAVTITSTIITDCEAEGAGAIWIYEGTLTITSSAITRCQATNGPGGAVITQYGSVSISSTSIADCSATDEGGAIYASSTLDITSSAFSNCSAAYGGAIMNMDGTSITSTTFSNCSATDEGGGIYNSGNLAITSSAFSDCSAVYGGAIYAGDTLAITSSTFSSCSASYGGAIYAGRGLTVTSSTFTGCSAAGNGGAIAGIGDITVTGTHFNGNSASADGGAIAGGGGTLNVTASNIVYCTAGGRGGAFSATGPGTLHYNRLYGNTATGSGAVIYASSAVDATNNWWGSGSNPAPQVSGPVTTAPWLVLGITADPSAIMASETSVIRTNLTGNSAGTNTSAGGHVMDDIIANGYAVTSGSGSVSPHLDHTVNGVAGTTFTPQYNGTVTISGTVDDQTVYISLPVGPVSGPTPPVTVPTYNQYDTGSSNSDFPPSAFPLMTVTVNIGGDSKAWQAIVTGTKLSGLIVTGTVQHGAGDNVTAPPGVIFQYISFVPARYNTITNAVINFTVPQAWLDENDIAPGSIVLYRLTANGWEALPTTVLHAKDGTAYFSAQSGGFSLFAIAGMPTVAAPEVTATIPQGIMSGVVQSPAPAAVAKGPATTQTTAPPAPDETPAGSSGIPVLPVLGVVGFVGLVGGGWYVRRWWIRRQNPALFEEY